SSQYWNQVPGFTPEDVEQDAEGLQTMRTLAVNMAWLLKGIEADREKGLARPKREAGVATNFTR
ncbi:MAG: flavodoxin family protein, partial [Lachnospiraceae bacterium]|nr:flavodoxin family protein [Lachnospiraceae bacterium]